MYKIQLESAILQILNPAVKVGKQLFYYTDLSGFSA